MAYKTRLSVSMCIYRDFMSEGAGLGYGDVLYVRFVRVLMSSAIYRVTI
jgi:hypothetical protein